VSAKQLLGLGTLVVKSPQALPGTATATLYTVSGAVLVTGLLGRVTTVLGSTATTLALGTTASSTTSIATATTVTSAAAGSWIIPTVASSIGAALTVKSGPAFFLTTFPTTGGIQPYTLSAPFFLAADAITWTTSATDTGQVEWYLWYMPLDQSATVS
jgi:hypothetical protein